jgi:serine/threonine protein kinase
MYGAVHRAQREGQRHLRALVVDSRLLAEPGFHRELLESSQAEKVIELACDQIVPTLAIESEGPDVVVLTRGVGRYVTVQDMLASSRARGFKIERSVVAAVAIAVADALAAAHRAHVVHGAVHPRSVLVDEEGAVRLTDFGVGRALTSAVAQGGDSQLWRGLAGFLAPELAIGAMPGPESDVFALGALVFVMLTGDAPPGTLATTAAVERVVSKALDTESNRRYRHPGEVAEALRIAFATDGWALASPAEIIAAAGLQSETTGIDSDTEDLLAALGSAAPAPVRPSMDLRAEVVAARPAHNARTSGLEPSTRLEALLADLGDESSTAGPIPTPPSSGGEPVSRRRAESPELVAPSVSSRDSLRSSRRRQAGSGSLTKLDPPSTMTSDYDVTPLPPPHPQDSLLAPLPSAPFELTESLASLEDESSAAESTEDAAMSALDDLRDPTLVPSKRPPPASKTPAAAVAALSARKRPSGDDSVTQIHSPARRAAAPAMLDAPVELPVPSLRRSPLWSLLWIGIVIAAVVGAVLVYQSQKAERSADEERREREIKAAQELSAKLTDDLPDPGGIRLDSSPSQATGWLLLGRAPFDSLPLSSEVVHQVRVELERYASQELTVDGTQWQGSGAARRAEVKVKLARATKTTAPLSAAVAEPPPGKGLSAGSGKIHFESDPPGAAVWLYIGVTGSIQFNGIAGQPYELRALKDGYLPGYSRISADDWRVVKDGAPVSGPIDSVQKKPSIDVQIELAPDPDAPAGAGGARRKGA